MLRGYQGKFPQVGTEVFIDDSAQVIGDVVIGDHSSVWFNTVVRGDVYYIRIGNSTNIQDSCVLHVTRDVGEAYECHVGDFRRVRMRSFVETPEIDIDELVLLQAVGEARVVTRAKAEGEIDVDAEFLAHAPARRDLRALAQARMAAAGIRPQAAGMVFRWMPLLQQDAPAGVAQEHRERAMQEPGPVCGMLLGRPDRAVVLVDQDDLVAGG